MNKSISKNGAVEEWCYW